MTDEQAEALAWLTAVAEGDREGLAINAMSARRASIIRCRLAEPRLPKEPSEAMLDAMSNAALEWGRDPSIHVHYYEFLYRALYAHLTRPHVDYAALDEARMEPRIEAAVERAFFKSVEIVAGPHNCTPAARDDLRKAISVLRGWSAEAAGRTGLAESVLIVCNAAESTLPLQMYRIRGRNFEMVRAGPISISEVPND